MGNPVQWVLGVSSREAYPESVAIWVARSFIRFTYRWDSRRVGFFSFARLTQMRRRAAPRERVAAIDAPWPFRIMRPTVTGLSGDYTLLHGIVDTSGRFERLTLVTSDETATKELMPALQQWEFRPASRDGQPTAVEILLIIPHRRE